jgi:hypothetical protein
MTWAVSSPIYGLKTAHVWFARFGAEETRGDRDILASLTEIHALDAGFSELVSRDSGAARVNWLVRIPVPVRATAALPDPRLGAIGSRAPQDRL